NFSSGIKPRLAPRTTRAAAPKLDAFVQPKRPFLPEFDDERQEAIAGPVWWPGYGADREFCSLQGHGPLESKAAFQRGGLLAGPGADLRQPRTRPKIAVRLGVADPLHCSAQAYLPVHRFPVKQQRRLFGSIQFLSL